MATTWDPWAPAAGRQQLDQGTRDWLRNNRQGGTYGGFTWAPNGQSQNFNPAQGEAGAWETDPSSDPTSWSRIALDESGNPIGRDVERWDTDGNYQDSYIGGARSGLDKYGWAVPLAMVGGALAVNGMAGSTAAGAAAPSAGGFSPITAETLGMSTAGQSALGTAGVGSVPSQVIGAAGAAGASGAAGGAAAGAAGTGLGLRDAAGIAGAAAPLIASAGAPDSASTSTLAATQASENERINNANLRANRPNVNSPFGSSTWSQDANGNWTQNVSLSPREQARLDRNYEMQDRTYGAAGRAMDSLSTPFSFGGQAPRGARASQPDISQSPFGQRQSLEGGTPSYDRFSQSGQFNPELMGGNGPSMSRVDARSAQSPNYDRFSAQGPAARDLYGQTGYADQRDEVESAVMDRFNSLREPQLQRQETALDTQLRNQGLMPGTEGYDNAMNDLRQSQATERSDMAQRAVLAGGQEQSRLAGLDLSADAQRFGQQQQGWQNQFSTTGYNNDLTGRESADTFGRTLQAFGFNNAAGQGEFDNSLRAVGQRNSANEAAVSGNFSRGLQGTQYNNNLSRQGLTDRLDVGNYNAARDNDVWGRYRDTYQFGADERQREYDRDFRTNAYTDDRALQQRGQAMNEFQAFSGWAGPNVNMPVQGPTGMSNQTPFNYYGAGMDQYGMGVDRYNRNIGAIQSGLNFATNWWG